MRSSSCTKKYKT